MPPSLLRPVLPTTVWLFVCLLVCLPVAAEFSHIVAVASNHGKNIVPRVAVKLDAAPISDVTAVKGEDTFERPMYAGE